MNVSYENSGNDVELNVFQRGDMNFHTNNLHWMQLRQDGNLGLSDIWAGPPVFTPVNLLHLNKNMQTSVWEQFTNGNTGVSTVDGFHIGLDYAGAFNSGIGASTDKSIAKLIQWENTPIKFTQMIRYALL